MVEQFDELPLPNNNVDQESFVGLAALGGCLCLRERCMDIDIVVTVLVIKEYGVRKSWSKLLSLKLNDDPIYPIAKSVRLINVFEEW